MPSAETFVEHRCAAGPRCGTVARLGRGRAWSPLSPWWASRALGHAEIVHQNRPVVGINHPDPGAVRKSRARIGSETDLGDRPSRRAGPAPSTGEAPVGGCTRWPRGQACGALGFEARSRSPAPGRACPGDPPGGSLKPIKPWRSLKRSGKLEFEEQKKSISTEKTTRPTFSTSKTSVLAALYRGGAPAPVFRMDGRIHHADVQAC